MKLKTGTSSIKGTDRADKLAARRERDRARRQAKRTADVWAMPADAVPTEERGKYNTFFEVVEGYRKAIAEFKRGGCDVDRLDPRYLRGSERHTAGRDTDSRAPHLV